MKECELKNEPERNHRNAMKTGALACLLLFSVLTPQSVLQAQGIAEGGVEHIFSYPVGARAVAMGGAYIASPSDASAVYWNPGGLDRLARKSFTLYYANLLADGQQQFLSYAHPTVNFGTIGLGVIRVGVSAIDEYDDRDIRQGSFPFAQTQFILSYGKQLPYNLAIGSSMKIEQQDFILTGRPSAVATGVGMDIGITYQSNLFSSFLQNLSLGFIIQNAFPSTIQHNESVKTPRNFKVGMAAPIRIASGTSHLLVNIDFEKGEGKSGKLHFGTEYSYQGNAMIRFGINGKDLVYGFGAVINKYKIDYSYESFSAVPTGFAGHRLSFSMDFGKTKQEIIQAEKDRRDREILARVTEQTRINRQLDIQQKMKAGKSFYQDGEYLKAYIQFNAAAQIDPKNATIRQWASRALEQHEKIQQARIDSLQAATAAEKEKQRTAALVSQFLNNGRDYFESGRLRKAISEWESGLRIDPENAELLTWIDTAKKELNRQTNELINQANRLASRGKFPMAVDKLREVQRLGIEDPAKLKEIQRKITLWNSKLDFESAYRRGLVEYERRNWKEAIRFFDQALSIEPNNTTVRDRRDRAEAWMQSSNEKWLNNEVKEKWRNARRFLREGRYQEAYELALEIYRLQPRKIQILRLLEDAEAKVK